MDRIEVNRITFLNSTGNQFSNVPTYLRILGTFKNFYNTINDRKDTKIYMSSNITEQRLQIY